ncbi:MAG TPA: hypothetical protein VGD37_10110 [Kofleriaceae bacterium]
MPRFVYHSTILVPLASAIVALGLLGCDQDKGENKPESDIASLSRKQLEKVKATFNTGVSGPRVIVFFSSGCAACDTGSAALQKALAILDGPITLFAVWEPIFDKDPPPTRKLLGNITDRRILQLWDPDHVLSDEMRASEVAHPGSLPQARTRTNNVDSGIMYDTVAIFPAGARWETTLPAPEYLEVGLEAILPKVREHLANLINQPPS